MNRVLSGYEPHSLFDRFEEISAIPRGSGNERGIADYLCAFAREHGLEYHRDKLHNVLIKKPASVGYEGQPPVILQGHTDMVCEKNNGTEHDFLRDGLKLVIRDGWLYADGTTLGADDGAAVAIMLALLEDTDAAHPPLECMFTVQEETGMDGAYGFDYSLLSGRTLINLDSEALDVATVSCAGGATGGMRFHFEPTPATGGCLKLTVGGLAGGHSGADIHLGRTNAIILMGRLLARLSEETPVRLVTINGGNKSNAIPRECEAVIAAEDCQKAEITLREFAVSLRRELTEADIGFALNIAAEKAESAFSEEDTLRVIRAVCLMPNGVLTYSPADRSLVESSSSLGIIKTDGETVTITVMPRSSVESRLDDTVARMRLLAGALGADITFCDRHPGWEYAPVSRIREVYIKSYESIFEAVPRTEAIHAGLECGIIGEKLGGIDAVSIGPEMHDIHTPNEHLNLQSFSDSYTLVKKMLSAL